MKSATRLLASVQRGTQFLEAGAPTGLTGLLTHSSPRGALLYLYSSTLDKLKSFPDHSIYKQSAEALTKHRMSIVENVRPAGLEEWQKRVQPLLDEHPDAFRKIPSISNPSEFNIVWKVHVNESKPRLSEDEESKREARNTPPQLEGAKMERETTRMIREMQRDRQAEAEAIPQIEDEPRLSAEQINEIESKIGAGLIEEIIQVAEGEKELAHTLYENQVWEDLEEKPQGNQWHYHERDTHTGKTQAP